MPALARLLLDMARRQLEREDAEDHRWHADMACRMELVLLQALLLTGEPADSELMHRVVRDLLKAARHYRSLTGRPWDAGSDTGP